LPGVAALPGIGLSREPGLAQSRDHGFTACLTAVTP
jgi:hypothetical protein